MTDLQDLIAAVRRHAETNYNTDGWDFLVECWDDADILEEIGNAKTEAEAIKACRRILRVLNEHREEMTAMRDW